MSNITATLPLAEISNIASSWGSLHFWAKFKGMRKQQDFIVYPHKKGEQTIVIQSDTRIGELDLNTCNCRLSASIPGGAYFMHLSTVDKANATIKAEDLAQIKAAVLGRHSGDEGAFVIGLSKVV